MKLFNDVVSFFQGQVFHTLGRKPMDSFLVEHFKGKPLVGCEIGVAHGLHSDSMLCHVPIKRLYLVDPFCHYDDFKYGKTGDDVYQGAHERIDPDDRVVWIREFSDKAAKKIKEKLDFVYIDGNHSYEWVKKDIAAYYPLVKSGGVIGGHDFCCVYPGVAKAVLEFCESKGLELKGDENDWWAVK